MQKRPANEDPPLPPPPSHKARYRSGHSRLLIRTFIKERSHDRRMSGIALSPLGDHFPSTIDDPLCRRMKSDAARLHLDRSITLRRCISRTICNARRSQLVAIDDAGCQWRNEILLVCPRPSCRPPRFFLSGGCKLAASFTRYFIHSSLPARSSPRLRRKKRIHFSAIRRSKSKDRRTAPCSVI